MNGLTSYLSINKYIGLGKCIMAVYGCPATNRLGATTLITMSAGVSWRSRSRSSIQDLQRNGMNPSHDAAIEEYKNGNDLPLIQVMRETLKKYPVIRDFLVLIIQRKVKRKPGPKAGKEEKRDRRFAARVEALMRTKTYRNAILDLVDETNLSEETIRRAYSKYATRRKSRPCS